MKKKVYLTLLAVLCTGLLYGCGKDEAASGDEAVLEEATEEQEAIGLANPIEASSKEDIEAKDGIVIELPEGCKPVSWVRVVTEPVICEVTFDYEGKQYVYRTSKTGEFTDISGMYYDWDSSNVSTAKELNYDIRSTEEGQGVVLWYDTLMHTVSMTEGADTKTLTAIYQMFVPSEESTELTAPESVQWGYDGAQLPDAAGISASWATVMNADGYEAVFYTRFADDQEWLEAERVKCEEPSASFFFQDYGQLKLEVRSYVGDTYSEPFVTELSEDEMSEILGLTEDNEDALAQDAETESEE
ncbi:MAG: hypothetical protein K6G07_01105 [Lachnospiraceae bacterium]|nr:hypothetical protein [Lachnospiraceae bacterium]